MYGYIIPDKPNMYVKDFALFRAFYCGSCKTISKHYGQSARYTTNYETAFFALFMHSYFNRRPLFIEDTCILNPFVPKLIAVENNLLERVAAFNILLADNKLADDVTDGFSPVKKTAKIILSGATKTARSYLPDAYAILRKGYSALLSVEKEGKASVDRAADPYAQAFADAVLSAFCIAKDADLRGFFYNLAKFVYILDALDDLEEDAARKCFNPFTCAYGVDSKKRLREERNSEMRFLIGITLNEICKRYEALGLTEGKDLIDNVLYKGLMRKFDLIYKADKKLAPERF